MNARLIAVALLTGLTLAGCMQPSPSESQTSLDSVFIKKGWPVAGTYAVYAGDVDWSENDSSIQVPMCWASKEDVAVDHLESYVVEGLDKSDGGGEFCGLRSANPDDYTPLGTNTT